jgi:biofilm protein TabA
MIFGNIHNMQDLLSVQPVPIQTALKYLASTDFGALPAGSYELQGRDIYAQVFDMTTKPFDETRPEVHRQYLDVQFLCWGEERIGVATDTGRNVVTENLLEQRDLLFYAGMENESTLTMLPGSFAVFFPSDVHRPGCQVKESASIRKVVVKVRVALLEQGGSQ